MAVPGTSSASMTTTGSMPTLNRGMSQTLGKASHARAIGTIGEYLKGEQNRRLVVFDFDRTLSVVHVFYRLVGEHGHETALEKNRALVDPPHASTERGQVLKLVELGPAWIIEAFGGARRVAALRKLLKRLDRERGVQVVVLSKGYIGVVRKCLQDLGLLKYFAQVFANVGFAGRQPTDVDLRAMEPEAMTLDTMALLGKKDEGNWGSKKQVVRDLRDAGKLDNQQVFFIDDDSKEVNKMGKFAETILVRGAGISHLEAGLLLGLLEIPPENLVETEDWAPPPITASMIARRLEPPEMVSFTSVDFTPPPRRRRWCCLPQREDELTDELDMRADKSRSRRISEVQMSELPSDAETHVLKQDVHQKPIKEFEGCATTLATLRTAHGENARLQKFSDAYVLEQELARGGFGTTYKAVEKASGRPVVVKKPNDISDVADFSELKDKASPHVVRVYDFFQDEQATYIVMEYCAGGDLYRAWGILNDKEPSGVSANWCSAILFQVVNGVLYLHNEFKQQHNDIKPENILLEHVPESCLEAPRAMIADFGCVAGYGTGKGGDPRYCAPEVIEHGKISNASDVWSIGVTLFELLTGKLPFIRHHNVSGWYNFMAYKDGLLFGRLMKAWTQMSRGDLKEPDCSKISVPTGATLACSLLQVEVSKRPPLNSVLNHKFFELGKDLSGTKHGKIALPSAVVRAHVNRTQGFKLREVLLELLETKLAGEHLNYYTTLWHQVDTDNNGVLNKEEFAAMWGSVEYPAGQEKPSVDDIFQTVDVDQDGKIEFDEFVAFTFDPKKLDYDTREQYLHSAFASIAGSGTGITLPDFRELFSGDALPVVEHLFHEMDDDQDGTICYKEFAKYILELSDP